MRDSLYENVPYTLSELKHFYGPTVHLVGDPYLLSLLAALCAKDTQQPEVNRLVRALYASLATMVVNKEFPRKPATIPTRMIEYTPRGIYQGDILDLAGVVREQILLAQPMKRLCREDCKGVCPTCGADRNLTNCGCPKEAISTTPFSSLSLLGSPERAPSKNAR